MKLRLSIIIVNYNTRELLRELLESICQAELPFGFEVIVSDNHSLDGSTQMVNTDFPQVSLVKNRSNLGFSKANNVAVKKARGDILLFLNSDTIINSAALVRCVDFLDSDASSGACGVRVLKLDGTLDAACRRSFPTPSVALYRMLFLSKIFKKSKIFARYNLTYLSETGVYEVDSLVGAFMAVRRSIFNDIGAFDEDYFMYGEDIDLCYKIKTSGHKIFYLGDVTILHKKGGSTYKGSKIIIEFYRAMVIFYKKNFSRKYFFLLNMLVYLGINARCALELGINLFRGLLKNKQ